MQMNISSHTGLISKAREELITCVILALYLYVCFGAVVLYSIAILREHDIAYTAWGFAAAKALILAKFMLMGNAVRINRVFKNTPLIYRVPPISLIYLIFLLVLTVVEEICVGFLHSRPLTQSVAEVGGGSMLQLFAESLLLWLILIPVVSLQLVSERMGRDYLYRMFFIVDDDHANRPVDDEFRKKIVSR
jgi:hypothetical protein